AAVDDAHAAAVHLAVLRVENAPAFVESGLVAARTHAVDDAQALHRLVLALVGAQVADGVGALGEDLLDATDVDAFVLRDADQRLRLLRLVVDAAPQPDRRRDGLHGGSIAGRIDLRLNDRDADREARD